MLGVPKSYDMLVKSIIVQMLPEEHWIVALKLMFSLIAIVEIAIRIVVEGLPSTCVGMIAAAR